MTTSQPPTGASPDPHPDGVAATDTAADPTVTATRRYHLDEDVLATVVGLVLLGLVLTGVVDAGIVP